MTEKVSPLAPKHFANLPAIEGVSLGAVEAGIKYKNRKDLCAIVFDKPASVAGVFTQSKCPSAPVNWCRKILKTGKAGCVVINSGNANAFTGMRGEEAVKQTASSAAEIFGVPKSKVYLASTGVIGEPLDASAFGKHLSRVKKSLSDDGWMDAARAIMTTDTFPKLSTASFEVDGKHYTINGIAKGSGMIAPDMATMLGFLVTDAPFSSDELQKALKASCDQSFNAITVDSDTSTSDTVLLFSVGKPKPKAPVSAAGKKAFRQALDAVARDLALQIVRDGEGASKQVEIEVCGATSRNAARAIAFAIANSPLVKTAIAGEDANWGRIVMAVGKAGQPAERDKIEIIFGDIPVARDGERMPGYSEAAASAVMKAQEIAIKVDLHLGKSSFKVWTCDLTKDYVAINADYRS